MQIFPLLEFPVLDNIPLINCHHKQIHGLPAMCHNDYPQLPNSNGYLPQQQVSTSYLPSHVNWIW